MDIRQLEHFDARLGTWMVTIVCDQRWPAFAVGNGAAAKIARATLDATAAATDRMGIDARVVDRDHVHFILNLCGTWTKDQAVGALKAAVTRELRAHGLIRANTRVWQRSYHAWRVKDARALRCARAYIWRHEGHVR